MVQYQFEITAGILLGIGFVVWLIRLEAQVKTLKEENREIKMFHEKEIQALHQSHTVKDRTIWDKIDSVQTTLNTVLQSVGRMEGKLENHNYNQR